MAESIASDISQCQQGPDFKVTPKGTSGWPRLFSYTAGDAGSGWFAVVPGAADVTLIQIIDAAHPTSIFTQAQVTALAEVAQQRLARYGSGTAPTPSTTTGTSSGPKAIDQVMQVTGPSPVPASKYFIAASQWSSSLLAPGGKTYDGQGNPDDSLGDIGVFCETKDFLSGFGGQLGEVEIMSGPGDGNVIGHQRVRIDQATDKALAQASVKDQLGQEKALLAKGCTDSGDQVTATKGPTDGTYLLTKNVTVEATGKQFQWVGVAPLSTSGAWTTVVFQGTNDGQGFTGSAAKGFAELDRLLALARQK